MSAADWGIPTPAQGMPITPFAAPFQAQGDAIAAALDILKGMAFPRYTKKADLPTNPAPPLLSHATVFGDTTALNGDYVFLASGWTKSGAGASQIGQLQGVTSNSNGELTVNHALGAEPRFISIQWFGSAGANDFNVKVVSKNATAFVVRIYYNGATWTNQTIAAPNGFMWKAEA